MGKYFKFMIMLTWCIAAIGLSREASAKTAAAPCLSPLTANAEDPDVRNITMFPAVGGASATLQACIVSNRDRLATLGIIFSVFDQDGNFLASGGQSLGQQSAVDGAQPNQPKIIATGAAGLTIPHHQGSLLGMVLIQLQWSLCQDPSSKDCVSGPQVSTTLLRDVIIVAPGVAHRRKHAENK